VQKQISAFQILKEIIEDDIKIAAQILSSPKELEDRIYDVCEEKYEEIGQRVSRGITRSIIYIFVTKIIFAIVIEIPYEYFLLGGISLLPLFTTIFIPILFVLLVAITIKKPGEANTERILEKLFDFVYVSESEQKTKFSLTVPRSSKFMYQAFAVAYGVLFLLTFGAISYVLKSLGFNLVSGAIFFIFLSLVLLFAYRVKYTSSELNVTGESESLLSHLISNITLPLLDLGVWLSDKFAKFNFFIAFLDFLIEAPLKNVIGVADEWTSFVKERREEVVEVPVER
jgi:tetrahydromethanopterin S-methyltransferase subunit G